LTIRCPHHFGRRTIAGSKIGFEPFLTVWGHLGGNSQITKQRCTQTKIQGVLELWGHLRIQLIVALIFCSFFDLIFRYVLASRFPLRTVRACRPGSPACYVSACRAVSPRADRPPSSAFAAQRVLRQPLTPGGSLRERTRYERGHTAISLHQGAIVHREGAIVLIQGTIVLS